MKKIIFFLIVLLGMTVAEAQNYDFMINSSTDTASSYQNFGGFDAQLFFKINADDTTTVTLVEVIPQISVSPSMGTSIVLPPSVLWGDAETGRRFSISVIGNGCFHDCRCSSLELPNTIKTIRSNAFQNTSVDSLTINGGVQTIEDNAFPGINDTSLPYVEYFNFKGSIYQWLDMQILGEYANPILWSNRLYQYDTLVTDVVVPEGYFTIPPRHFSWNLGLRSVVLPSTLDTIGAETFKQCRNLDSISLPISLRYIGNRAFDGASSLRVVDYNARECAYAGAAGMTVFAGCSVSKILLGEHVRVIPDYIFMYCNRVSHIDFPEGLEEIGKCSFAQCSGLNGKITIHEGVTRIGEHAFASCIGIDTLELNSPRCYSAGGYTMPAFYQDTTIRVLEIGRNVEIIPNGFFYGLRGVNRIISHAIEPPYVPGDYAFVGVDTGAYVTVPCGSEWDYREAYGWDRFLTIRSLDMFDFVILSDNEAMGTVEIRTPPRCEYLYGEIWAHAKEGYEFTRWSDGSPNEHRWVAVAGDTTITAYFQTATTGIGDRKADAVRISVQGDRVYVAGVNGEQVLICDMMGRVIENGRQEGDSSYKMPGCGVYLVKVGGRTAQKVVLW